MKTGLSTRRFVPASLNVADFAALEPWYQSLLDRNIDSATALEAWLLDVSELWSVVDEYAMRRYIDKSCHTDDAEIEQAYMHYVSEIEPRLKPLFFALQEKYCQSPYRSELDPAEYAVFDRRWAAEVELFRPENVPLETLVKQKIAEYDKICGAMTVEFQGEARPLPLVQRYLEETDRDVRQAAWEGIQNRRAVEREKLLDIFDELLEIRGKIAAQAGLSDYRSYVWKETKRFDYTPEDCARFAEAVAACVVPLAKRMQERRRAQMGLDRLRPWDLSVDPQGLAPLRPFAADDMAAFVSKTGEIIRRVSPDLARDFARLVPGRNLDLDARKGKAPGGYQESLHESREPFIFMNSAGTQNDLVVLLHEAGHAFHFQAACHEPVAFLRSAPLEFCEVASMSMELFAADAYDVVYSAEEAARAKSQQFERVVTLLPWIATIDSFQHWIYAHPGHTRDARRAEWLRLGERFGGSVDWSGYEEIRAHDWLRQLHLFHAPFYYIEYGIAQLGALQLWHAAKRDAGAAIRQYRQALALGGKKSLPDLFAAAGAKFEFSATTIEPLMAEIAAELSL